MNEEFAQRDWMLEPGTVMALAAGGRRGMRRGEPPEAGGAVETHTR
jgi:hypothetical protein